MKTEHRIVCRLHGTQGHSRHIWPKRDRKHAVQSVIDANHHAEMMSQDHFYKREAPHRRQEREVTDWEDADE